MSKDLENAGIIASVNKTEDSIFFNAVVVVLSVIGYAVGIIIAIITK